jgi:hypothetical protein
MATHRDLPSVGYYIAATPIPVSILAASWLLNKKARTIRHGGEEPRRIPESTLRKGSLLRPSSLFSIRFGAQKAGRAKPDGKKERELFLGAVPGAAAFRLRQGYGGQDGGQARLRQAYGGRVGFAPG